MTVLEEWVLHLKEVLDKSGKKRELWAEELRGRLGFTGYQSAYGWLSSLYARPPKRPPSPEKADTVNRVVLAAHPGWWYPLGMMEATMIREEGGAWVELDEEVIAPGKRYEVMGADQKVFPARATTERGVPVLKVLLERKPAEET